ncbi:MAG: hypothetical protein ABIH49_03645 [archaeon]
MKPKITFDEWLKFDLRVGEVAESNKDNLKINCCDKEFHVKLPISVKKGEKIVIGISGDKVVIPVIGGNIPLAPEKDIEVGSKIR